MIVPYLLNCFADSGQQNLCESRCASEAFMKCTHEGKLTVSKRTACELPPLRLCEPLLLLHRTTPPQSHFLNLASSKVSQVPLRTLELA